MRLKMGTQQIILLVLGVILIGVSVASGIFMFQEQAINSSRQACLEEMNRLSSAAKAWWITPQSMGGGGRMEYLSGGGGEWSNYIDQLGRYLGHNYNPQSNSLETLNASYKIEYGGKYSVKFVATGKEYKNGEPIKMDFIYNMDADTLSVTIIN